MKQGSIYILPPLYDVSVPNLVEQFPVQLKLLPLPHLQPAVLPSGGESRPVPAEGSGHHRAAVCGQRGTGGLGRMVRGEAAVLIKKNLLGVRTPFHFNLGS